ncbi:MAG: 3'(2'),5'-bisphosphate nucleotidase CysQ [Desulfobacteraceae bacterium]|nr:3'(2'),5'-bisphosphate nucleotidase CysQ [Desulfobacteraceae bacterium]MBC2752665.1 3'(2'),5'-bisphosphate nucleotidase CysQ [Desulfobacteraceae bacterium]
MGPLLYQAIEAAIEAGQAILKIYKTDFTVAHKPDQSPLTLADSESHRIIVGQLETTDFPILSEEGRQLPYKKRQAWNTFWLLDPLDGTKEFVKRNGEFTVNIALITDGKPVMGVIYVPVADVLYFGTLQNGAHKMTTAANRLVALLSPEEDKHQRISELCAAAERLPLPSPERFTVVGSRSHSTPDVDAIVEKLKKRHGDVDLIPAGSSLKICMVAEGRAQLYPRTGPTMEWDTAAGQAIAEAAGAQMVVFDSGEPMRYNKENLLNPWFIVKARGIDFEV